MEKHVLQAEIRKLDVKPNAVRQSGYLPANLFGQGESQAIQVPIGEANRLLSQISESTVFYIVLGKKELPVMLGETQRDPLKGQYLHLSLRRVDLKQKVVAAIPVKTEGNFNVPGALYVVVHDEVEAEGLPTDLPESFIVDLTKLTKIGDEITFADLAYDRQKVTLKVEDEHLPVVVVDEIKEEAEAETDADASAETTAETVAAETKAG